MARDGGLEELLAMDLAGIPGLLTRSMFGGLVWLEHGSMLCGARHDGLLARLGAGREEWALALPGIVPMSSRGLPVAGWVWASETAYGDDAIRRRLLDAAMSFVRALPARATPLPSTPWDFPEAPAPVRSPARFRRARS